MPGFKSLAQRKFLFATDKDKQKGMSSGINPTVTPGSNPMFNKSIPNSIPGGQPSQMIPPPATHNIGVPKATSMASPQLGAMKPTATPSLPAFPKFAKVRKYLKKEF